MRQTTFRANGPRDSEAIVVPLGTARLVREGFRRFGLRQLIDGFKEKGVPMGLVIENLCISCLNEEYSMDDWDDYVNRSDLRREYFCSTHEIKRWTFQRDLDRLGDYLEEVVDHLVMVWRTIDPDGATHAYVDGSHIKRYGPKGSKVRYGEGAGTVQLQNQFMTSSLIGSGIPVSIELYPGNQNDPQQYKDFIPQLLYLLKRGSLVVMDNGGSAAVVLNEILERGDHYLTRVRINASDERVMAERRDRMIYVGMDAACIMHTFESSGRTIYLYFSADSYAASVSRAQIAVARREMERQRAQKLLEDGDVMGAITLRKSPFYEVRINDAVLVMTADPWVEIDPLKELKDAISPKGGWFKLECSFPLDPRLALVVYRHRVDIEHMISSLKSVVNLSPMRVWAEGTTRGRVVLALITQFLIAVLINDLEPRTVLRTVDGKPVEVEVKPSDRTVVRELRRCQGVVTRNEWGGLDVIELRDEGVADELFRVLDRYAREPPIRPPEDLQWRNDPTAQWGRDGKNCRDLAMSIAQLFSETIFPEYMSGRSHWKTGYEAAIGTTRTELGIAEGSLGTMGLRNSEGYYRPDRESGL